MSFSHIESIQGVVVHRDPSKVEKKEAHLSNVKYNFLSRPGCLISKPEEDMVMVNPVDSSTGLMYDKESEFGADWSELVKSYLWHACSTTMQQTKLSDHPLLIAERSYNPAPVRQELVECLFEELNVPATFFAKDAVLACYGCGRTTATVVDVGYSGTTVSPVCDGYVEGKGLRRTPVGLRVMDEQIMEQLDQLLHKKQPHKESQPFMPMYQVQEKQAHPIQLHASIHLAARLQVAQECRESGAGAAIASSTDSPSTFHAPNKPFSLPDGTIVDVPSATRFAAADLVYGDSDSIAGRRKQCFDRCKSAISSMIVELQNEGEKNSTDNNKYSDEVVAGLSRPRRLRTGARSVQPNESQKSTMFSNRLLKLACRPNLKMLVEEQLTSKPLPAMICDSAYSCDRDQQAALLGTVVLTGGGTCLGPTEQAVPDCVKDALETMIHKHTPAWRVKVLAPPTSERPILPWLGGSILGSMGSFHDMWISRAEYEEFGASIVNRKCP